MGINVVLCTEQGLPVSPVGDDAVILPAATLAAVEASSTTLRFIDPFGNTMFNAAQASLLADELAALYESMDTSEDRVAVATTITLARQCASALHKYLWFIGD